MFKTVLKDTKIHRRSRFRFKKTRSIKVIRLTAPINMEYNSDLYFRRFKLNSDLPTS